MDTMKDKVAIITGGGGGIGAAAACGFAAAGATILITGRRPAAVDVAAFTAAGARHKALALSE
jgi:NAD(P)-dependent dehydrogenase (short-subunit alcohol dehydrogenase family)